MKLDSRRLSPSVKTSNNNGQFAWKAGPNRCDTVIAGAGAAIFLFRPADAARPRNSPAVGRRVPSVWESDSQSRRPIGREALARLSNFLPHNITAGRTPTWSAWKRRRYRSFRIIRSQGRSRASLTMPLPLDAEPARLRFPSFRLQRTRIPALAATHMNGRREMHVRPIRGIPLTRGRLRGR